MSEDQAMISDWRPFETAPKEPIEIDVPLDIGDLKRLRIGPEFMARGAFEGEMMERRVCWSIPNEEPGRWWDTEAQEPLDWPMTEWRQLTTEEAAEDEP